MPYPIVRRVAPKKQTNLILRARDADTIPGRRTIVTVKETRGRDGFPEEDKMAQFRFSVGPWNVHSGADSYGPATRAEIPFEDKVKKNAEMGFSAIQFHDDDAVPDMNSLSPDGIRAKAR